MKILAIGYIILLLLLIVAIVHEDNQIKTNIATYGGK